MEAIEQGTSRRAFAVSVYLINDRKVLLIKHARLGIWLPVGGEMEMRPIGDKDLAAQFTVIQETPIEAARREVKEETGLDAQFIDRSVNRSGFPLYGEPLGLIGYEEHPCGSKGLHMCFSFVAWAATREIAGDGSFTDVRWVSSAHDVPPETTTPSVRELITRALHTDRKVRP